MAKKKKPVVKHLEPRGKQPKVSKRLVLAFVAVLLAAEIIFWGLSGSDVSISNFLLFLLLVIPLGIAIFVFIFWLWMLIDALEKQKYIWAVFIFFGHIFIALLYYLVEKPKLSWR